MESVVRVGLDIGQKRDPTAIAVVEAKKRERPATDLLRWRLETLFVVRDIGRLPLGTSYPEVAEQVARALWGLRRRFPDQFPSLWVDATGVGRPIVDILREMLPPGCALFEVTFVAGTKYEWDENGVKLGKAFLVSRLQALLQTRRIRLPDTPQAQATAEELRDYEIRVDENARESFGAMKTGSHDDLVTALGLAALDDVFDGAPSTSVRQRGGSVMKGVMTEAW